jgi:hypothetical protein
MSDVEAIGQSLNHAMQNLDGLPLQQAAHFLMEADTCLPAGESRNPDILAVRQALTEAQEDIAATFNHMQATREHIVSYAASLGIAHMVNAPAGLRAADRPVLPPDPIEHEEDIFACRLKELERELANGQQGEPTKFLSGLEVEFHLMDVVKTTQELGRPISEADLPQALQRVNGAFMPDGAPDLAVLSSEERQQQVDQLRDDARAYVEALTPANEQEAARKQTWLEQVDDLNSIDLINFKLYREFSNPTLGETAPPKNGSFEDMQTYADQSGWLEFRFGNGTLQSGYYDNPGFCELRITPCSPSELVEREKVIMQRLAEITSAYGVALASANTHINLSVYRQESEQDNSLWQPVLGTDPSKHEQTLDAVAGLGTALRDGLWMNETTATDKFLMGDLGSIRSWDISSVRSDIRVPGEYVELRTPELKQTTEQGLLWMMAGMNHGLENGREPDQSGPTITPIVNVQRTEQFDKETDLQLQRMIESGTISASSSSVAGILSPSPSYANRRGESFAADVLGEPILDKDAGASFAKLLLRSAYVDNGGKLRTDQEFFTLAYDTLTPIDKELLDPHVQEKGLDFFYQKAQTYIDRDAVRITQEPRLTYTVPHPGRNPAEWDAQWQQSPLMQKAYGDLAPLLADHLAVTAAEHYQEIDITDNDTLTALVEEMKARGK